LLYGLSILGGHTQFAIGLGLALASYALMRTYVLTRAERKLTWLPLALVAVVGLGPTLGVPLFAALAIAFELVKAFGLAVLGASLGGAVLRRVTERSLPVTLHVFLGVTLMLAMRVLPWVGSVAWTVVSLVALGVAVFTVALAPQRGAVRATRSTGAPRS
jgi:hypothetical protein